jgi:hypothetical protein
MLLTWQWRRHCGECQHNVSRSSRAGALPQVRDVGRRKCSRSRERQQRHDEYDKSGHPHSPCGLIYITRECLACEFLPTICSLRPRSALACG